MRSLSRLLLLGLLVQGGCSELAWSRLTAASDEHESETETETGMTTTTAGQAATATSATTDAGSTTTSGGDATTQIDESEAGSAATGTTIGDATTGTTTAVDIEIPPEILSFDASPDAIIAAGPLKVTIQHSADVVEVEIWRGGQRLRQQAPDSPAWTTIEIPIVHLQGNLGAKEVVAIVRDAGGLEDSASELVTVTMPKAGTSLWHEQWSDESQAEGRAVAAVDATTVTAGFRITKSLEVRPTLGGWSYGQGAAWSFNFLDLPFSSAVTALAGRPGTSEYAVAGNLIVPGDIKASRPWVRFYSSQGPVSELWQDIQGATTAVNAAVMTADGDVILAGDRVTFWQPIRRDVSLWILPGHLQAYPKPILWENPDKIPKENDDGPEPLPPNDQALAIALLPDGDLVVVGETGVPYKENDKWDYYRRALALRYSPAGALKHVWIAPLLYGYGSRALGVGTDPEGSVLVAGWTRASKGARAVPLVLCLSPTLTVTCAWAGEQTMIDTEARRVQISPTGQIILGVSDAVGLSPRARILGLDDRESFDAPAWTYPIPMIDGLDVQELHDLAVDTYGSIHYVGSASDQAKTITHPFGGELHG